MATLPSPDHRAELEAFAQDFDGYGTTPTGEPLQNRAAAKRRETLEDLRAELFCEARAARFNVVPDGSDEPDTLTLLYRELLPQLIDHGETPSMIDKHEAVFREAYFTNYNSGAFSYAWGKKSPRTWLRSLELDSKAHGLPELEAMPDQCLSREALRQRLWSTNDPKLAALLVLAWGEMRADHARRLLKVDDHNWLDLVRSLRSGMLTRGQAYDEFARRSFPGLGPAYFTKLIYFLRYADAEETGVGYIMDQWTATSINLLFGYKVVEMSKAPATRTGMAVSNRNNARNYETFNRLIEHIATQLRARKEHVEMTLFGQGGKGAKDVWRPHVIAALGKR